MLADPPCQELQKLRHQAWCVLREVRGVRRLRDVSFLEDAQLNAKKYASVTAIVKHLLAGHQGSPCPAGSRPIVSSPRLVATLSDFLAQPEAASFFCSAPAPPPLLKCLRAVNRAMSHTVSRVIRSFNNHPMAQVNRRTAKEDLRASTFPDLFRG